MAYVKKLEDYHHLETVRKVMEVSFIGGHPTIVYAPNGTTYDNLYKLMSECVKEGVGATNLPYTPPEYYFHNPSQHVNLDLAEKYHVFLCIPEIDKDAFFNPYKSDNSAVVFARVWAGMRLPLPTWEADAWSKYKSIVMEQPRSQRRYYALRLVAESTARWRSSSTVSIADLDYSYNLTMVKPEFDPMINNVWHTPVVGNATFNKGGSNSYSYHTPYAQASWVINHNLNGYPQVSSFSSTGEEIFGDVVYTSLNVVTVTFAYALSGAANLSL